MAMDTRRYQMRGFSGGGAWITPTIKLLFFVNAGIFLVQTFASVTSPPAAVAILRQFGLIPFEVIFGLKVWQPVTYMFLHGGMWHFLVNMLVLWMFGCDIERAWGQKRFLQYYFVTGAGAGLCIVAIKFLASIGGMTRSDTITIGASGAIYGILMAAALLFPDRQIWLIPFPVMLPMRAYVFVMGLIAFFGSLGESGDGVSHLAHLSGLFIGWAYLRRGTYFYSFRNVYLDWQRRRTRRRFEVYKRRHQEQPPSRPDDWVN
jgi:membrane associated rhomboid family serine protease